MSRKNEIYTALLKIIERDGFTDSISMSSIANEVGIGKSTLYEYFPSKKDLFIGTHMFLIDEAVIQFGNLKINDLTCKESFRLVMMTLIEQTVLNHHIKDLLLIKNFNFTNKHITDVIKTKIIEVSSVINLIITRIMQKGIDEGLFTKPTDFEIRCATHLLFTITTEQVTLIPEDNDYNKLVDNIFAVIVKLFKQ